jgi:hypothetical protein
MAILPNSIYSPDHLRFCIGELRSYAVALAERDRGSQVALPELSVESSDLLHEIKGADSNRFDVVTALASELERHLESAPNVTITLAAPAPHGLKIELVRWLRDNILREVMVEFLVNPDISGGMILRTRNKVYDLSFRTKLLENSARFVPILEAAHV